MSQRISGDLVSYSKYPITFLFIIVDKPDMQPRKDYDDYTSFLNDSHNDDKNIILDRTL